MLYCVYEENIKRIYRSTLCSSATLTYIFLSLFFIIFTLTIAYNSQGFWVKEVECREQPDVTFQKKITVQLKTSKGLIFWSTQSAFNNKLANGTLPPLIKSREDDHNLDGLKDLLHLQLKFPAKEFLVFGSSLIISFNYKLKCMTRISLEGGTYIHHKDPDPISAINFKGDLTLLQRTLFSSTRPYKEYESSIFSNNKHGNDWQIDNILKEYWQRNVTTVLENSYITTEEGNKDDFIIDLMIRYASQNVKYHPSFWNTLKWGWMQYLALGVISTYAWKHLTRWVFTNHIVRTWVEQPCLQNKTY